MLHRFHRIALCAALVAGLTLVVAGAAGAESDSDKPMIVKIHADWCGTCTKLNPTMAELEERLGADARVVVLDVTDRDAVTRSAAEADRLGITEFFMKYRGKTGTVGVIASGGEVLQVYKGELDADKYIEALAAGTPDKEA